MQVVQHLLKSKHRVKPLNLATITLKITRKGSRGYQISSVPVKLLDSLVPDSLVVFYSADLKRLVIMGRRKT